MIGVHCGYRTSDNYLKGNCRVDYLFSCTEPYIKANFKGGCSPCSKGAKPGIDYCAIG